MIKLRGDEINTPGWRRAVVPACKLFQTSHNHSDVLPSTLRNIRTENSEPTVKQPRPRCEVIGLVHGPPSAFVLVVVTSPTNLDEIVTFSCQILPEGRRRCVVWYPSPDQCCGEHLVESGTPKQPSLRRRIEQSPQLKPSRCGSSVPRTRKSFCNVFIIMNEHT